MSKHFYFIVNPIAGPFNNERFCENLCHELLMEENVTIDKAITKHKGHAYLLAKEQSKNTDLLIVSMGGDGTFNEVASALVHSNASLAHIPRGSGNGLARMLNIPRIRIKTAEYLQTGSIKRIDAGKINDNQFFFCTCGFGFDAYIAHKFNKSKIRGSLMYGWYIFQSFLKYKEINTSFSVDGVNYDGEYFIVTFSNANQYGVNAKIAPHADVSDGLIDVTLLKPFPRILAPVLAASLLGGFINKMPYVKTFQGAQVKINSVSSPYFHIDGEALNMDYPAKIVVYKEALKLHIPSDQKFVLDRRALYKRFKIEKYLLETELKTLIKKKIEEIS
jgi:YegS/Rv2252/BmrU family lipid kinase